MPTMPPFRLPGKTTKQGDFDEAAFFRLREREILEQRRARDIRRALQEQLAAVLPENATDEQIRQAAGALQANSDGLRTALGQTLLDGAQVGIAISADELLAIALSVDEQAVLTAAREWASRNAATLVRQINDTTRRQLQTAIAEWFENDATVSALIEDLQPTFGGKRAVTIARTEITRATWAGYEEAARQAGAKEMEWYTLEDEFVCPICGPMHGKRRMVGGKYSGDVTVTDPPPAHPNCRCGERMIRESIGQ